MQQWKNFVFHRFLMTATRKAMELLPQARRSGTKRSGDQALAGPGTRLAKQFAPKRIIKKNQKKADKIVCQKKKIIKK